MHVALRCLAQMQSPCSQPANLQRFLIVSLFSGAAVVCMACCVVVCDIILFGATAIAMQSACKHTSGLVK